MIKDKSMGRKLIFLDIDGTLLPPGDMLIPESTLAALDRARANGHKLFLCTGRNHRMTEPLLRHDCFAGAVCSAGGYVLCDGKTLVDIPMEPQQAEGVRAALERNGVECTLEARDATFGGSKMAERWKFIHKKNDAPLNSEAERWRKAMEEGMSFWEKLMCCHSGVMYSKKMRLPATGARGSSKAAVFSFRLARQAFHVAKPMTAALMATLAAAMPG